MKSKRLRIAVIGILALVLIAVLISRSEEREEIFHPFERFVPMLAEGYSQEQVNEILQQSTEGPVVIASIENDLSAPLGETPVIKPKQSRPDPDLNELRPLPNRGVGKTNPHEKSIDPLLLAAPSLAPVVISAPLQSFDGVSNVNGVLPPDTNGDVGPNHYVQWVNLSFAIYSKTGTLLYGPAAGNTLWTGFAAPCSTSNDGDPIVQYDHLADRWMMSQFALPNYPSGPFYQCIAVSQTGDPTGAWYRYAFQISGTKLNDYPHFGVWPDGYYMSVNQFVGNTWGGAGVVAFERDKMLQGLPAQAVYFDLFTVDPNLGGMLPSDLDGPAPALGTPNYFLQADDNGFGYPQDQLEIWQFSVNWTTPSASTFTQAGVLPVAAFDSDMCAGSRNCIAQSGTTRKLDAISDRLMYRLQYRSIGGHQTLLLNQTVDATGTDRAGIRWYELRNAGSGWSIFQQGTFSPDATARWMGSIAMDVNGNIGLGYSASSSSMFPAIRYTGRLAADAAGTMTQGEGVIINGTGAQTHTASRWGDYSSLSVDPVDGCTFWYTNEYVQTTGSAPWRTRIGSFQLPGCGSSGPTPTPTTVPPSPTPTNTPLPPTATNTPLPGPANTGFLNPSANAAQTGGDGNGYQTNPTNGYTDNSTFAVDTNSGTNSNSSCTNNGKDKHQFSNYGISIPGSTILGIEVRLDARADSTGGSPKLCIQLSWNAGSSWTAAKQTGTLTTTEQTYTLGSASDNWGHAWTLSQLSNANFRVRIIDVASNTSRDFSLDWITVRVTYQ